MGSSQLQLKGMNIRKKNFSNVVILTGAGVSVESGLRPFRGPNGLWTDKEVAQLSTIEALESEPLKVNEFYNGRRRTLLEPAIKPNDAHFAIAELQKRTNLNVRLITQNVDNLHERAGSSQVWHMHGELLRARCGECEESFPWGTDILPSSNCPLCHFMGSLRPDIVLFGEIPKYLEEIDEVLDECDLFICIGTSGHVYPAAGFVQMLPRACHKIEINIESTEVSENFNEKLIGPASLKVPEALNSLV